MEPVGFAVDNAAPPQLHGCCRNKTKKSGVVRLNI